LLLADKLEHAVLLRRYKRFLADVQLPGGETVVAHCPNPGSMLGCAEPGSAVVLRYSSDPKRKLPYTWIITRSGDTYINVDTLLANKLLLEALQQKQVPAFVQYDGIRPELTFGDSRFDFGLYLRKASINDKNPECIIEVKSTTLADGSRAMFPDAKTVRGVKHLHGLIAARQKGIRAVQFFCISRTDSESFSPADHIDPAYGSTLRLAAESGVEVMAWCIDIGKTGPTYSISFNKELPVIL
jgi:sugar fermentation stimulation protein A